jgi:glycosyltransferase involved in cell wall biosynthesis
MKKVLIGITSKNRADILPKAINSALNQKYQTNEVRVYDDCSSDNTAMLVHKFPSVNWNLSKEEKGYLFARNQFLSTTDADYFCSLDDDSWFLNDNYLSVAIEYMNQNPRVAALAFNILTNESAGEKKKAFELAESNNFIGCGHLLRVAAVKEVGMFSINPGYYGGEEKDLCIRLMDSGYKIMQFPEVEIWHEKTNVSRDIRRQYRSNVCNDLVFGFRRTPGLILVPVLFYKLLSNFRFTLITNRKLFIKPFFNGVLDFLKFLVSRNTNRNAVKMSTYRKFIKLNHINK